MIVAIGAITGFMLWWRGPDWNAIPDAFQAVRWEWVAAAVALNLLSICRQEHRLADRDQPGDAAAPAALPARLLRLLRRPARERRPARQDRRARARRGADPEDAAADGRWATLVGTVFAHRVFDIVPALLLIAYVLATADIPDWALTSLIAVVSVGSVVFLLAFMSARRHHRSVLEEAGTLKRVVTMARYGLA